MYSTTQNQFYGTRHLVKTNAGRFGYGRFGPECFGLDVPVMDVPGSYFVGLGRFC